jgi:hypothetical protein
MKLKLKMEAVMAIRTIRTFPIRNQPWMKWTTVIIVKMTTRYPSLSSSRDPRDTATQRRALIWIDMDVDKMKIKVIVEKRVENGPRIVIMLLAVTMMVVRTADMVNKIVENRVKSGPIVVIMLPAVIVMVVELKVVPCTPVERETRVLLHRRPTGTAYTSLNQVNYSPRIPQLLREEVS